MYNYFKPVIMSTALLIAAASCATQQADDKVIDKPDLKITDGIFSVEALEAIGRVTEPVVSPDETKILYGVSYESIEENASNRDL